MSNYQSANQIISGLWLGNLQSSQDLNFLRKNKISVIINCTKDLSFINIPNVYKYRVPVHDDLTQNEIQSMCQWLNKILPIIDHHHKNGHQILIHCFAGIQRSAIVMLTYLYLYQIKDPVQTLNLIKSKRPIAFTPSMNFIDCFKKRIIESVNVKQNKLHKKYTT